MKLYKSIKFFVFALFCGLMLSTGVVKAMDEFDNDFEKDESDSAFGKYFNVNKIELTEDDIENSFLSKMHKKIPDQNEIIKENINTTTSNLKTITAKNKAEKILSKDNERNRWSDINVLILNAMCYGYYDSLYVLEELYLQDPNFVFFRNENKFKIDGGCVEYTGVTPMHCMLQHYQYSFLFDVDTNTKVFDFVVKCLNKFKEQPQLIMTADKKTTLKINQFMDLYCQNFLDDVVKNGRSYISSGTAGWIMMGVPFVAACAVSLLTNGWTKKIVRSLACPVTYFAIKHGLNKYTYVQDDKWHCFKAYDYKSNELLPLPGVPLLAYGAGVLAAESFSKLAPVIYAKMRGIKL